MNKRLMKAKQANPAAVYNEKRRIVFARYQKDPIEAKKWLEGYRNVLGPTGFTGLSAELEFFERYRRDFELVPALDVGDATDFAGVIDGVMYRIDVTTNLELKKLQSYEPLQAEGYRYKIAVYDRQNFELVDINFPFCSACKTGRVLPTTMLLGENFNRHGESTWTNDQLLVKICGDCGDYAVVDRTSTHYLYDFEYWYNVLNEVAEEARETGSAPVDVEAEAQEHAISAMRYLKECFGQFLVAVGGQDYKITNRQTADGFWTYRLVHVVPLVQAYLRTSYAWDINTA